MRISNDLYDLIKALEKQEKRYFKLYMNMSAANLKQNMIELFDAIDKQEEYDENKLKLKFKNKTFVKQFHVAKNRLYNSILKSLEAYYADHTIEEVIKRLLHQAEILMDKALYDQGKKKLDKAKKLAEENEQFLFLIDIFLTNVSFFGERHNLEELKKQNNQGYDLCLKLIERYKNFMEINMLSSKLTEFLSARRRSGDNSSLTKLFSKEEQKLLKNESQALSFQALVKQLLVNSAYSRMLNKMEESYKYRLRLVNLLENNLSKIKGKAKSYISALNNLLAVQVELSKFKGALESLDKLKNIKTNKYFKLTENRTIDIDIRVITGKLLIYNKTYNFDKLNNELNDYLITLKSYDEKIPDDRLLIILYHMALSYFYMGKFDEATGIYYQLLNHPKISSRKDVQSSSLILNLICYFELKNQNLIESNLKFASRFFKSRENPFNYEELIIKYIRKCIFLNRSEDEFKNQFLKFKNDIEAQLKHTLEENGIKGISLLTWIESVIENIPFEELIKRKKINIEED